MSRRRALPAPWPPPPRPTRYHGLGYRQDGRAGWRIVDMDGAAAVGAPYASKAELLADLARFAAERGYAEGRP